MRRPASKLEVCGGFDGSESEDWTAIRLETVDGFQFTPTYGPDKRPTIWNPVEHGGRIPKPQVHAAVDEIFHLHTVKRFYCDPRGWQTEIDGWALNYGDEIVLEWDTGHGSTRIKAMHAALERFVDDLIAGALTHDDCPITATHVANARKAARSAERYILEKASGDQKIDAAMASVLAHEAAADARKDGWALERPKRRRSMSY